MKLKYIICVASLLMATGCNDGFLERSPQNINDKTFWSSVSDLETYANAFYSMIPGGVTSLSDGSSDNQVPNNPVTFIWNQYSVPAEGGGWSKSDWSTIRQLNYFMTHYEAVTGTTEDINKYVGEIRFFRALAFMDKVNTFGDVPWLDKNLDVDSEELYGAKTKRNEVAKKIIEDLNFAIQWLPDSPETGRIGKDVARHIKARFCLQEGTYYKYHTSLGFTADVNGLLEQAAAAALDIMNTGKYEIYNTGKPESDYYDMFVLEDKSGLKEAILWVNYEANKRQHGMSRTLAEANMGFSKDFADSYLCKDGKPIALSSDYQGDETMRKESTNRDPRFKQTILTNDFPRNVSYDGDSTFIEDEGEFISQYCYTGYKSIKYFIPTAKAFEANSNTYDGIAYRYAETLLIYAEAKAELGSITQADLDKSVNVLRDRVGLPHLMLNVGFTDPNWPKWGYELSPLLQEIRRERRVELAGEGLRWGDLKRWKAGQLLDNVMTYVGKKTDGVHYAIAYPNYTNEDCQYVEGKSRKWVDKLYLYPIPTGELQRNELLLPQNPGWE